MARREVFALKDKVAELEYKQREMEELKRINMEIEEKYSRIH